jgi:ABC-type Zn2+ transport system substrate-binding protein/surface adhesin
LKKLKATFEAAKDDPEYVKMAAKVGIHSDLILDKDHDELQEITNGFWTAYNQEGAFFKQKQKKGELKVVLAGVKKKGKFIVFEDKNGKQWKTRIHRKKTKFTLNGEKFKGAKKIKKARKALKSGDECTITYIGMPIVAKSAQCISKGSSK